MTGASPGSIRVPGPITAPGAGPPDRPTGSDGPGGPGGSDGELWRAIAADGPQAHAAFAELFQRHAEAVWNYTYGLTAS